MTSFWPLWPEVRRDSHAELLFTSKEKRAAAAVLSEHSNSIGLEKLW